MFRIKLLGQKGPKGGSSKSYFYGMDGKTPVAVTTAKAELIKVYKTKATAIKNLENAKKVFLILLLK